MKTLPILLASLLPALPTLHAQVVPDGATNTLDNVTNTVAGDVTVGSNGSFTLLLLTNGALLTNGGHGFIGRNAGANSNTVRLTGANTRWLVTSNLFIGSNGSFNRLMVGDGALVGNNNGTIGAGAAANDNEVVVTGGGSFWSNRNDLTVGSSGNGNQLIVSNGGRVGNATGYVGRQGSSSGNTVTVTGAGSYWSNRQDLYLGFLAGGGNRLVVEDGGLVGSQNGYVGRSGPGNNDALVAGVGSLWSNRDYVYIGSQSGGNRLVVSNGGHVLAGANGVIGSTSSGNSNLVLVSGVDSLWSNQLDLIIGGLGSNNLLVVSNGGTVVNSNAWFGATGGRGNKVVVTGAGSLWSNRGEVYMGRLGFESQLVVSNGGIVFTGGDAFLGHSVGSSFALLTDPGSRWMGGLNADLYVGSNAGMNRLIISNGAVADGWRLVELGNTAVSSSNELIVTGSGSLLSHSLGLIVGRNGSANRLVVSNGGAVRSSTGLIGHTTNGINNEAIVTGSGSVWSNAFDLNVGSLGRGNRLIVSNGGLVFAGNLIAVGATATSTNNRLTVDGGTLRATNTNGLATLDVRRGTNVFNAGLIDVDQLIVTNISGMFENKFIFNGGTLITRGAIISSDSQFSVGVSGTTPAIWDVRAGVIDTFVAGSNFFIGSNTSFNQLLVTNGALLNHNTGSAIIGFSSTARSNTVTLAGAGSRWANSPNLVVGNAGSFNRVVVSNGAVLTNILGIIGVSNAATSNEVIVTGAGSVWGQSGDLFVGSNGVGNRMVISNGGLVLNQNGHIGRDSNNFGNTVVVTGTGSVWNQSANLFIGSNGGGNRLIISNGGHVANGTATIGSTAFNGGNTAVVTGTNSVWSNRADLIVGDVGVNNLLVVSNGGLVLSSNGFVGRNLFSPMQNVHHNSAVVTDAGSRWLVQSNLYVGSNGVGNLLMISNGAVVESRIGIIGGSTNASNNQVIVTGPGSRWLTSNGLFLGVTVGSTGSSNRLIISDGGLVTAGTSALGQPVLVGSNNFALVTGAGSSWSNQFDLDLHNGSLLVISNGGFVRDATGRIGAGGNDNVAIVTGSGSVWSNIGSLGVGVVGLRNRLVVSNGGLVYAGQVSVGPNINSIATRLIVDGGTLHVTNVIGTGFLDVARGTNVLNAGLIDVDRMVLTNAGGVFEFNGGTLITRSAFISNGAAFNVGANGSTPAVWDVRAGASNNVVWNAINIGLNVSGSQLLLTNGALLTNSGSGFIGRNSGADSNSVIVTGAGSRWSVSAGASLFVGNNSAGNRLVVSNGGQVSSGFATLGAASSGNSNQVVVTGAGSVWSNQFDLVVGEGGSANMIVVSNGGLVVNSNGLMGDFGTRNVVLVTGSNSTWSNRADTSVGFNSSSNQLAISEGGRVFTGGIGRVGHNNGANANTATVTGTGSVWSNQDELYVGQGGSRNQLLVSNGGTVFAPFNRYIGGNSGANSNAVTVTDPGSGWLGPDSLYVGSGGAFNRLTVSNGGLVTSGLGTIGGLAGANGNLAIVTGAGSIWSNQFNLTVGEIGGANQLVVSNGGRVVNHDGVLGFAATGDDNTAVVTGMGTAWSNRSNLFIGLRGGGNELIVSNGGTVVAAGEAVVGGEAGAVFNSAVVSDPGSRWLMGGRLVVGSNAMGNRLIVSNGAEVLTGAGAIVGFQSGSAGNVAVVTGSGSLWSNASSLFVGFSGAGNQLIVSDGGVVRNNSTGIIGVASSNNLAVVTGSGSLWSNAAAVVVGNVIAGGNRLVVSNGGTVFAAGLIVGDQITSTGNRVVVDGGILRTTNAPGTSVVDIRRGTNVLNAGLIQADRLLVTNTLGVFEFNGGTLITKNTTNNNGRVFTVGNGTSTATFQLLGGTHAFSNNLVISSNATLAGNGTILGNVTNFGTISAGTSAGSLRIDGNLTLTPVAGMSFELGGLIPTNQYDQVTVTNFVQFAGTLSLSLLNGFLPDDGDTFTLVSFGSAAGNFANAPNGGRVNLTNNLASFAVNYTATNFVLGDAQYVDSDGDGQGDLQEQAAGTDPNNPASALQIISITENASGHKIVQFLSESGKTYRIEHTTNLQTGFTGLILAPTLTAPAAGVSQWVDDGTLTGGLGVQRFYRIGLQ